ncbi:uncharacterized protein TNCV_3483551 [Trichonephila clavipes]|nr:uncharacterized protein TNCV_3483551 [Trichonephila clavipes]
MEIKTFIPELLKKCLHGSTQNPNERVNNAICSRVPKNIFVQIEALSLGICDVISSFNMGNVSKPEILRKLNIESGDYTVKAMERLDKQRLLKAKYSCLQKQRKLGKKKDLKGREREEGEMQKIVDHLEQCSATFSSLWTGQRLIILPWLAEGGTR